MALIRRKKSRRSKVVSFLETYVKLKVVKKVAPMVAGAGVAATGAVVAAKKLRGGRAEARA